MAGIGKIDIKLDAETRMAFRNLENRITALIKKIENLERTLEVIQSKNEHMKIR